MPLSYRVANAEDRARLAQIHAVSFGFPYDTAMGWYEKSGYDAVRVLCDGESVLGGLIFIPMGHYFGRRSVACDGIAGVAIAPGLRQRGTASELMRRAVREMAKRHVPLSSLYPASIPLYRRAGYQVAGATWEFAVSARELPRLTSSLRVRAFREADDKQVRAIYADHAKARDGWLDRGPYVWERTRRVQDGKVAHGYVFEGPKRIEAYVFYRQSPRPLGYDLKISDMAARTPDGYRAVLGFLRSHKSVTDDVHWYGGVDDPWLALVDDRHYAVKLHHHWMLRITDLPRALEARGYRRALDVSVTLIVRDDLLKTQNGSYRLRVSGGAGSVTKGKGKGLTLDVRTLAAIYSGQLDAHMAARLGWVTGSAAAIERLASLFAGPAPSLNDLY